MVQADTTLLLQTIKIIGLLVLTAVIEATELEKVTVTEFHTLADDITERGDLGNDGGLCAVAEGIFTVVHHRAIVIGYAQRAGGGVIVGVKVVFFACRSDIHLLFINMYLVPYSQYGFRFQIYLLGPLLKNIAPGCLSTADRIADK